MVKWGILKEDFNVLSNKDVGSDLVDRERVSRSSASSVPSSGPTPSTDLPKKLDVGVMEQQLKTLKEEILQEFEDVFVEELGEEDRIAGDPIKLEVVDEKVTPYHCWSPATV